MKHSAIAWDVDGTLIDSEPLHQTTLKEVCGRHGLDLSDLPDDKFCGVHMLDVWTALRSRLPRSLSREVWLTDIVDTYVARSGELRLIEDVRDVVADLAALGLRQVCVSNSSRRIVDANIAALGIDHLLEFSISFDDVAAGKPDPEPYRAACERLGVPPHAVVAVEDSATGASSARRAGLFVVGFSPHGLPFGDCDAVARNLRDLPAMLGNGFDRPPGGFGTTRVQTAR